MSQQTFSPVRIDFDDGGCNVAEFSGVCGLTRDAAIQAARNVYGDEAGIVADDERCIPNAAEWVAE